MKSVKFESPTIRVKDILECIDEMREAPPESLLAGFVTDGESWRPLFDISPDAVLVDEARHA